MLRNLKAICRPGGVLATVLQLPSDHASPVADSPFSSLKSLASAMHLVSPAALAADANAAGFELLSSRLLRLSSGKEFAVQSFQS